MKSIFFILFCTISLFAIDANMEIIKNASQLPTINVIKSSESSADTIANKLVDLVKKDIEVSCHFKIIDSNISLSIPYNIYPNMIDKSSELTLVLQTTIKQNEIELGIKLYDMVAKKLVLNNTMSTNKLDRFPFLAHKTAIIINDFIKAPNISWMDRFVIFSRYVSPKETEIVVADYTLNYQKVVVKGGLNIFPKWVNSKQEAFYYSTFKAYPTLMKFNLVDKSQEIIASSDGMIVCSDISNDGSKLLLTMAPNTQSDIYLYDLGQKQKTRLTTYSGIDVGAHFIDDETKFAFISDRLKTPSIFIQNISQTQSVSKIGGTGKNTSSFSSYKDFIAYSSKESGDKDFNIYLVATQSNYKKQLTINGKNEFPRFSQGGEAILFIKKNQNQSMTGIYRVGYDQSFFFPSKVGALQSIDW